MTDNEIIQSFKERVDFLSSVTSVYLDEDEGLALYQAAHSALELINRKCSEIEALTARTAKQEATIDRLENEKALLQGEVADAQAEIERLQADNKTLENVIKNTFHEKAGLDIDPLAEVKAEAIKEFAKRLKEKKNTVCAGHGLTTYAVGEYDIDCLLKEMVGDTE